MNILNSSSCNFNLPWGNTGKDLVAASLKENVIWFNDGSIEFRNLKEVVPAWYMDSSWNKVETIRDYSFGMVVSKDQFYYGDYRIVCQLPNFRGSWPALWFIDTTLPASQGGNGMGIPPEIDVFEHFRKKGFWNRFKTTHTYHDKPFSPDHYSKMTCKAKKRLCPVDNRDISFRFLWTPNYMMWFVDAIHVMTIEPGNVARYPDQPMNIVLGGGFGNWGIDDKRIAPFIVKSFEIL